MSATGTISGRSSTCSSNNNIAPTFFALFLYATLLGLSHSFSFSPIQTPRWSELGFRSSAAGSMQTLHLQIKRLRQHRQGHGNVSFTNRMVANDNDDSDDSPICCWNPSLRRTMGTISAAGMTETAYLTYTKLFAPGGLPAICGTNQCGDVLSGPYSSIHLAGADIPLSVLGFAAYTLTTMLALFPLMNGPIREDADVDVENLDSANRIALLATTTFQATFSSFLVAILFGVLQASCPFCVASAILSVLLGILSWSSDIIPPSAKKLGAQAGLSSFGMSTVLALVLFFNANDSQLLASSGGANKDSFSSTLMASTAKVQQQQKDFPPPSITTHSSDRALKLAGELQSLDARMFGAYWCSHCYEQKQTMGLEAMQRIPYIECSKDGLNSQNALCKERDVPGYPTWEIGGKLYPGEQELDELEDIVAVRK